MFRGYGHYGGFGDVQSDAQAIFSGLQQGGAAAQSAQVQLNGLPPGQKQDICQAMGQLALQADAAAAGSTGQVSYANEAMVINACTQAGVQMPAIPGTPQALYNQLQGGDQAGVVTQLQQMDIQTRQSTCMQMGALAMESDVAQAQATGNVAYPNQNMVIAACTAAGVTMPFPGGQPTPGPTPTTQHAGIGTTGWVVIGVIGIGLLIWGVKAA